MKISFVCSHNKALIQNVINRNRKIKLERTKFDNYKKLSIKFYRVLLFGGIVELRIFNFAFNTIVSVGAS